MSKKPGGPTARHQGQGRLLVEDEEEYHARARSGEQMSSHMLQVFARCPAEWKARVEGAIPEVQGDALRFGSALHKLTLEGLEAFLTEWTVGDGPENPKTGKPYGRDTQKWAEWAAGLPNPGRLLSSQEALDAQRMARAVRAHPVAAELLSAGAAEMVARETIEGAPCQCRCDWLNGDALVDLKSCASLHDFERDCWKYQYPRQMAFYRMALRAAGVTINHVWLVAVDKGALALCGCWEVGAATLDAEEEEVRRLLREWKRCRETGEWGTGYEAPRALGRAEDEAPY